MKLLSFTLNEHDANASFSVNGKVKYISTERLFSVKHHEIRNLSHWKDVLPIVSDFDAVAVIDYTQKFNQNEVVKKVDYNLSVPTYVVDHHFAHALSAWPVQSLSDHCFVFDGQGNNTTTHTLFSNGKIAKKHDRYLDGSIAVELKNVGRHLKLKGAHQGTLQELDLAGKVMGYQSYGAINSNYYSYLESIDFQDIKTMWTYPQNFEISYLDWLRTVHEHTGDRLLRYISKNKGSKCFSGGLAQNSVFNGKLYKNTNTNFFPHVSDCGLSLGGIEFLRRLFSLDNLIIDNFPFCQSTDESPNLTEKSQIKKIAEQLAKGKIIGVYQGQGEVGPRALGNRSILMDPSIKEGKDIINNRVKYRESFRPFGATCLLEDAKLYFDAPKEIPYMNVNVDVKTNEFPSITHVDNSTRLQTVKEGVFYEILTEFQKLTGHGVLLNTSLNIAGKPIASKTEHAKHIFNTTDLDAIFVGNDAHFK